MTSQLLFPAWISPQPQGEYLNGDLKFIPAVCSETFFEICARRSRKFLGGIGGLGVRKPEATSPLL